MSSGESVEAGKRVIDEREVIAAAQKGIVETWNSIITTLPEDLIKLLIESNSSLRELNPNSKRRALVKEFLQNHRGRLKVSDFGHPRPKPTTNGGKGGQNGKPSSFTFNGTQHSVRTWKEVLVSLCGLIYAEKQDEFDHIMSIQGTRNLYFSRNRDDLSDSEQIGDSGIFAVTSPLNKNQVKERCRKVVEKFGYSEDLLEIE